MLLPKKGGGVVEDMELDNILGQPSEWSLIIGYFSCTFSLTCILDYSNYFPPFYEKLIWKWKNWKLEKFFREISFLNFPLINPQLTPSLLINGFLIKCCWLSEFIPSRVCLRISSWMDNHINSHSICRTALTPTGHTDSQSHSHTHIQRREYSEKMKIRKKCIFLPGHPTSLISNTPHIEYIVQFHVNIILILRQRRSREISVWYVLSFSPSSLLFFCYSSCWCSALLGGCHRRNGLGEGVAGINGKSFRIKI